MLPDKADLQLVKEFLKTQGVHIRGRMNIGLLLGAVLVPFFGWIDYLLYPQHFPTFMRDRLIVAGGCLILYAINRRWDLGYNSFYLGIIEFYLVGFLIINMNVLTNAYSTPYYAGLNLVFLTFCTILTIWVKYLAIHCLILYSIYLFCMLWFTEPQHIHLFVTHNMFIISTIIIILTASLSNQNLRWNEYLLRKRLEEAQDELVRNERLATLGKLTATVSHELRNPLGTIRASLFLIADNLQPKEPRLLRALDRAERNILRCDQIIDELADYARDRQLNLEWTPLDAWLNNLLEELALPEGITLTREFAADMELQFDREKLRRCMLNLISNGAQAIQEKKKQETRSDQQDTLKLETRRADDRVEIKVMDTGVGIPDEEMVKIFQPLFSTKSFGLGLGLVIIKQIVEQHGGGIDIGSQAGVGTTATIWLPLQASRCQSTSFPSCIETGQPRS